MAGVENALQGICPAPRLAEMGARLGNRAVSPPKVGASQLSDRVSSMTVFCYLDQMMSQKFSKNQDNFCKAIFIYCINCRIVGKVVLLKSKRAGFWANGQFTPRSAYILLIPQVLYRQVIFYRK